ncbi:uncharacterized protein LOC100244254 isoform X3 [Vitis vinifera]|uniref:uncharacterized protein LOC100244254 isoform X3 n=1 Tax=Vitis vinifera TaxID=29760 RepID=UPI0008FEC3E8|nr:uncharacterized protein LOC100244254 isoform X3 [Vitis vinifera]|eukprot:XP_019073406.1 PREDICTED: tRNA pseudouridine(38/39) synthase isoform X3 [Vitis vinifera]
MRSGTADPQSEGDLALDLISTLQSQLLSLRNRVQELEAENAKLSSQISSCHCHKIREKLDSISLVQQSDELKPGGDETRKKKLKGKIPGTNMRTMNHISKRYVALKVMYFGPRFYGFASEAHMDPTVESEIFKALEKTWLAVGDKKELQYSRCGRTDKGVSSVGQVIALFLRSNLKEIGAREENSKEVVPEEQYEGEIDYMRVLNRVLPKDIRVMGWCPVPIGFHARFSCLSREYKYFFWRGNLNILAMESAGKKFVGEHDFRNFCKMDAVNVHNYRRHIISFEIAPTNNSDSWEVYNIVETRKAHQKCTIRIKVVDALLDTERTSRKPQYAMAPEIPLVLESCEFEGLKFICSSGTLITDAGQALRMHLENECRTYQLQAAIFHEALLSCLPSANSAEKQNSLNNGTIKKEAAHIDLMSRPTEPSYEERRAKFNSST